MRFDIAQGDAAPDPNAKESEHELWWKIQEEYLSAKASVLATKEKDLIDRATKLAAREAEVDALRGSVISEGSGIAEELVQKQRQQ